MMYHHDNEGLSKGAMSRHLPRRGRGAAGSRNESGMTAEGFDGGSKSADDCTADPVSPIEEIDRSGSYGRRIVGENTFHAVIPHLFLTNRLVRGCAAVGQDRSGT